MSVEYHDFELEIISRAPFEYEGKVLNSPGGPSVRCPIKFKFAEKKNQLEFENLCLELENAILRGDDGKRGPVTRSEQALRNFGNELFHCIFVESGPIRDAYARSKGTLKNPDQRLRIKLLLDAPELARLPWEYLYDEAEAPPYVSLKLPVVRSFEVAGASRMMPVQGPLRILGMVANPATEDWPPLDEAAERRRIAAAIDKLEEEGRIAFEWVSGGTGIDLMNKWREGPWHIFHFIGHGGIDHPTTMEGPSENVEDTGYIVLNDENGRPVKKFGSDLEVLFAGAGGSLRLAVLNCCDSATADKRNERGSPAMALIRSGLPAVVAMQYPIRDNSAIRLSEGFYRALASNAPVDEAITVARQYIRNDSRIEWGIPVLYMRSPDGRIFEIGSRPSAIVTTTALKDIPATSVGPEGNGHQISIREDAKFDEMLTPTDKYPVEDLERLATAGREFLAKFKDEGLKAHVARVYFNLGRAQLRKSDISRAATSFAYAIELDPGQPEYLVCRANLNLRVGFYEAALSDVNGAIKLRPSNADFYWNKGIICSMAARQTHDAGMLNEAIAAFTEAIRLRPSEPKYFASRASAMMQNNDIPAALADIDHAMEMAPDDTNLAAHRARIEAG